jgi:hypothetical protein
MRKDQTEPGGTFSGAADLLADLVIAAYRRDPAGLLEHARRRARAEIEAMMQADFVEEEAEREDRRTLAAQAGCAPMDIVRIR